METARKLSGLIALMSVLWLGEGLLQAAPGSSLAYSTYLGGNKDESPLGLGIDGRGDLYLAGWTYSADFPTVNALQPGHGGGDPESTGEIDGFAVRISATRPSTGSRKDETVSVTSGRLWQAGRYRGDLSPSIRPGSRHGEGMELLGDVRDDRVRRADPPNATSTPNGRL